MNILAKTLTACLVFVVIGSVPQAADRPPDARQAHQGLIKDLNSNHELISEETGAATGKPLGQLPSSRAVLGTRVGDTWWDLQQIGSAGTMVTWQLTAESGLVVHFAYTDKLQSNDEDRRLWYNLYSADDDQLLGPDGINVQPSGVIGGFATVDVTEDNRGIVAGHYRQSDNWFSAAYVDYIPAIGFFSDPVAVPESLVVDPPSSGNDLMWPRVVYQTVPGQTPVLHVFGLVNEAWQDYYELRYFRNVGCFETFGDPGEWDSAYVVDTVFVSGQQVTASSLTGKTALVWIANRPEEGDCDSCSSGNGLQYRQWDNDIYYQISTDYGDSWLPRVNLTRNQDGVDGFRPFVDVEALIDGEDYLHFAYSARFWPADANQGGQAGLLRGGLFHWGESKGYGGYYPNGDPIITAVATLDWDQTTCSPGTWSLNGAMPTLAECDGKLYYVWSQYNDLDNGIEDDCASRADSEPVGAANADLYMSVSGDGGWHWDYRRNLTQTFSGNCSGSTGSCLSEVYPSLAERGNNIPTGDNAPSYDPSGVYVGDQYVDLFYQLDRDPGSYLYDEGTQQLADMNWIRLACVEPSLQGILIPHPITGISWPTWVQHGLQLDTPLVLYNYGNIDLYFNTSIVEYTGPPGWLTCSGFEGGFIPAGINPYPSLTGNITINTGGVVNNPGSVEYLSGALIFDFNGPESPVTFPIQCWVMDDMTEIVFDTVQAICKRLAHTNNGNLGTNGSERVTLDFFECGDCDTSDNIAGETEVYLYGGSPVVCWTEGEEKFCNQSVIHYGYSSDNAFVATTDFDESYYDEYSAISSDFITRDSGVGIRRALYTPNDLGGNLEEDFVVEELVFYSFDGNVHNDLMLGEILDWDIPTDSGLENSSGFNPIKNLIFQTGFDQSDDSLDCLDASNRVGGLAVLELFGIADEVSAMFVMDNALQSWPTGDYDPDSLWKYMDEIIGFQIPDSIPRDAFTAATFARRATLGPGDSLVAVNVLATSMYGYQDVEWQVDLARDWYCEYVAPGGCSGCCEVMGDIDHSGSGPDISDLVMLVSYMFQSGSEPPCLEEADCNGDGFCCDIADLVCWVQCMFQGGNCPQQCP